MLMECDSCFSLILTARHTNNERSLIIIASSYDSETVKTVEYRMYMTRKCYVSVSINDIIHLGRPNVIRRT